MNTTRTDLALSNDREMATFILMYLSIGVACLAAGFLARNCYLKWSRSRRSSYGLDVEGKELVRMSTSEFAHHSLEDEL